MDKFIKAILGFSLRNKFFVFFTTFLVVAMGIYSYLNTPIEAFPDVTNTRVQIITQWPGKSAEEIERFISIPIEVEMNSIPKKTSLRSISLFGLSVITIIFEDDVEDFTARTQVSQRLQTVNLPDGIDGEIQPPSGPTGEIFRYTLDSKTKDVKELKTIQDWVIDRNLKKVSGVADVVSFGGEVKTYEIKVDPNLLLKYELSAIDVFEAVSKSNVNVGGDLIERADQAYVVRGIGLLNNISEIENIIVSYKQGVPVLVRNVSKVEPSKMPLLGYVGRDTTENLVEGIVLMRKGENPSEVLQNVRNAIEDLNDHILPDDVKINTFYDRGVLINYTTHTVLHNLIEGVILVTILVSLFLLNWRTTLIVSIIIPLALLFAFICMRIKGMTANLISMGAIDFGIIIDGAVVMVEGLFVILDHKAKEIGMEKFNKLSKAGLIKHGGAQMGKAVFFSKLIIITALIPIFAFQKVEGKMFSPLAYTLGFALLGALIFTLTLVPVLISILLTKNVKERHNPIVEGIQKYIFMAFSWTYHHKKVSIITAFTIMIMGIGSFHFLGSEFLPHLNEGAIYIRASMPMSTSLSQSVEYSSKIRKSILQFDEVKHVLSQTGRPNDGTDPTGFFNIEYHVELKPKEDWGRKIDKEELINEMKSALSEYQGISFNFSQPIMDNVEEAVAGVKGSLAVKIFGRNITELETLADTVHEVLSHIRGVEDLGIIKLTGQPELRIELDQQKMATYGISTSSCQSVIEMAIGGKAVTQMFEGERKFDIRIRYAPEFRDNQTAIGNLMVPNNDGVKIPLSEIAEIHTITGPSFLYRENNQRFSAIKFSVRGRDLGGTIAEAQEKVGKVLKLHKGMRVEWRGEFENQVRATNRLMQVVPISITLIFFILFITFGSSRDAALVLMNVPFSIIGGIWALLITNTNFSISAGVGFIALFGICVQNGVILISVFRHNLQNKMPLEASIKEGVHSRIRPVIMTAIMAMIGLMPAALSTGIGSETQKPLAIVVIGGLMTDTTLTLLIFPLLVNWAYRKKHSYDH